MMKRQLKAFNIKYVFTPSDQLNDAMYEIVGTDYHIQVSNKQYILIHWNGKTLKGIEISSNPEKIVNKLVEVL